MSNETRIILRHAERNEMDCLPYGTACKVSSHQMFELYVQINKNEDEKPNWLFLGNYSDRASKEFVQKEIDKALGK